MNFNYSKWNIRLGWLNFSIAFVVYLLTIEPNLSFWDCGEYVSAASKLEITHAPGAAFFQLVGSFFSIFAFGNGKYYPKIINAASALYSAFTILFLFWTISHLTLKIFKNLTIQYSNISLKINSLISATIGALSFAFTDTFWFSAVEGEVYAMASCFIAMLLWLICKFENASGEEECRWILLISFIIGLSVGIHMMVLLAIPSLCLIYYIKHVQFNWKNFFIVNVIIFLIFFTIFKGFFPFIMNMFGYIEMFVINELKLPFHFGIIVTFLLLFIFFLFGIQLTIKYELFKINLILLSILFMLIGFSCWLVIPIRANANPPINVNNPNTALSTLEYYNREQYGEWPILYGPNYTTYLSKDGILKDGNGNFINIIYGHYYEKDNKNQQYVKLGDKFLYKYNDKHQSWFPRMYHSDVNMMENYGKIINYPEFEIDEEYLDEPQLNKIVQELNYKKIKNDISISDYYKYHNILNIKKPTTWQNLKFFINYQVGFMFFRYFFWNFIGKQNDIDGQYNINKGNWLSGINWFDEYILKLGNQNLLPKQFHNKSTNYYYFLPFILGMIGCIFQLNCDIRRFYALFSLFLLTSIGIVIYTNIRAFEPRERDYAYVGSFYVFSIWIGIGTSFLISLIKNKTSYVLSILIFIFIITTPILLISQNWDDHDRSNRTLAYDQSYSYLKGLDHNSILFTYGDNDTYPIWGIQETSNIRTDVRVINHTLLGTAWNIDQIKRKIYESSPVSGIMKHDDYKTGTNDVVYIMNKKEMSMWLEYLKNNSLDSSQILLLEQVSKKNYMTPKEAINYLLNHNNNIVKNKYIQSRYESYRKDINFLPVKKIIIPVNKDNAIRYGIVEKEDKSLILDYIILDIEGFYFRKDLLIFLDLLANYNWDRSIYFSLIGSYSNTNLFFLKDYLQYEGFTYKLVPIKTQSILGNVLGHINAEKLYQNIKKFKWGNFNNSKVYYDYNSKQNIVYYRNAIIKTVAALIKKNNITKAIELLNLLKKEIPIHLYCFKNHNINSLLYFYLLVGDYKEANLIINTYTNNLFKEFDYYNKINSISNKKFIQEILILESEYLNMLQSIINVYNQTNKKEQLIQYINQKFYTINKIFKEKINKVFIINNIIQKPLFQEYYKLKYETFNKFNNIFIKKNN